eukprot:6390696-Prymnesium_polylepis.1
MPTDEHSPTHGDSSVHRACDRLSDDALADSRCRPMNTARREGMVHHTSHTLTRRGLRALAGRCDHPDARVPQALRRARPELEREAEGAPVRHLRRDGRRRGGRGRVQGRVGRPDRDLPRGVRARDRPLAHAHL